MSERLQHPEAQNLVGSTLEHRNASGLLSTTDTAIRVWYNQARSKFTYLNGKDHPFVLGVLLHACGAHNLFKIS